MATTGKELDANIAILDAVTPTGVVWTDKEMAEICGSTQQSINYSWLQAKKKLSKCPILKQLLEDME